MPSNHICGEPIRSHNEPWYSPAKKLRLRKLRSQMLPSAPDWAPSMWSSMETRVRWVLRPSPGLDGHLDQANDVEHLSRPQDLLDVDSYLARLSSH